MRDPVTEQEIQEIENRFGHRFKDELEPFLVALGFDEPFWSFINRNCIKERSREIPTAGVTVLRDGSFKLIWNPDFIRSLTGKQIRGLIIHEFLHLILDHVTSRRRTPHNMWNIATDLAINCNIKAELLPKCGLYPGPRPPELGPWEALKLPDPPEGSVPKKRQGADTMTDEQKKLNDHMMALLESFPPKETADYYFERLMDDEELKKAMGSGIEIVLAGDGDGMDSHDAWDDLPDDVKEVVREHIKTMVGKGIRQCESNNQWGSVSADMQSMLREIISNKVDWRAVLRQVIGMSVTSEKSNSIKRVNRKYPYIHPGQKRRYRAKVAVYIDQSGSVGDENVEEMFGELNGLARHVDFTVFPFDTEVSVEDRIDWKRGQKRPVTRFKTGGTDFNAPTRHYNSNAASEGWSLCIIMSDGECCKPVPIERGRRAYIIVPQRKIMFEPDAADILIQMTEEKSRG